MNMQYFKEKICPFAGREYAADWRIMKQKLKAPGESLWKRLALWRSASSIPANIFDKETQELWGKNVVVVPMIFFAMPFDGTVKLSEEHTDIKLLPYEEAYELVYFMDQKIALYELNEKLLRGILPH